MNDETCLASLTPSFGRRMFAYVLLLSLGGLMIYLAIKGAPALPWLLLLLGGGSIVLWVAEKLRRGTEGGLMLYADGIRTSRNEMLIPIEQIAGIDRGTFAFKPSHGFLLKLVDKGPSIWRPGLIWRVGRRVGVGGVTHGQEAKFMAEMINGLIMQRNAVTEA